MRRGLERRVRVRSERPRQHTDDTAMLARVVVNETPNTKNTKLNRGGERYGSVSALLTANAPRVRASSARA